MKLNDMIAYAMKNNNLEQLNTTLHQVIPFNAPHNILLTKFSYEEITAEIPHISQNMNHVQGIHACGLATVAEYVSGLFLLIHLDPNEYRLMMSNLNVTYTYQAKEDCVASFTLSKEKIALLKKTVQENDEKKIIEPFHVDVKNKSGELVCSAKVTWQIKHWDRVKTNTKTSL